MTPAPKTGRPRGQRKAERRLARELADKASEAALVTGISDLARELFRTANSNPVIGLGLGIIIVDALYRARVLSYTAAAAFYGFAGATVAADIVGSIAGILPFSSGDKSTNGIQPTATTLYYSAPPVQVSGKAAEVTGHT